MQHIERPQYAGTRDNYQAIEQRAWQAPFMAANGIPIDSAHPIECDTEAGCCGNRRRPGLKAARRRAQGRFRQRDVLNHLSTGHGRRHRLQQFTTTPKHADIGRPIGLVSREGAEIDSERQHIRWAVRRLLGAVEHDLGPDRACGGHHAGNVGDRTRQIGAMGQSDQPTALFLDEVDESAERRPG
jgi:hypothetical protein